MNKIFDKRLYVLWSFIVLINSNFLQAKLFNEHESPCFDLEGHAIPCINPMLTPSQIIAITASQNLNNQPLPPDASPESSQIPWQDPMPYTAYQTAQGMPAIASNTMPEIMQQMRVQGPVILHQKMLPWERYILHENNTEKFKQSLRWHALEPHDSDFSEHAQFWRIGNRFFKNLHNLGSSRASHKFQGFFGLLNNQVPTKYATLYNNCLENFIYKFAQKDKSTHKYRITKIPQISPQELVEIFQPYIDLFIPDWRVLRNFIDQKYVHTCLCEKDDDVIRISTPDAFYEFHNDGHNTALLDLSREQTFQNFYSNFNCANNNFRRDQFVREIYEKIVGEKWDNAHQTQAHAFAVQQDPLYHSAT